MNNNLPGMPGILARAALQGVSALLISRGIGDEALWTGLSGALLAAASILWSHFSQKKLKKAGGL
ncbi:MAG: hypothetical protein C0436_04945 [Alphaproteobacteria bacterium]|nr:hypothetical protein [Alphaproteobacteria bacterium]